MKQDDEDERSPFAIILKETHKKPACCEVRSATVLTNHRKPKILGVEGVVVGVWTVPRRRRRHLKPEKGQVQVCIAKNGTCRLRAASQRHVHRAEGGPNSPSSETHESNQSFTATRSLKGRSFEEI